MRITKLLWAAAAVLTLTAAAPAPASVDFRGARMGMTMAEFQALPPLGGAISCKPETGKDNIPGDFECKRPGDYPFEEFGVVSYSFGTAADGQPRLYLIMLMGGSTNALESLQGLVERWGKPTSTDDTPQTNGLGQPVQSIKAKWAMGDSEISFEDPCSSVKYFCVIYTHEPTFDAVVAARKKAHGSAGSKF